MYMSWYTTVTQITTSALLCIFHTSRHDQCITLLVSKISQGWRLIASCSAPPKISSLCRTWAFSPRTSAFVPMCVITIPCSSLRGTVSALFSLPVICHFFSIGAFSSKCRKKNFGCNNGRLWKCSISDTFPHFVLPACIAVYHREIMLVCTLHTIP